MVIVDCKIVVEVILHRNTLNVFSIDCWIAFHEFIEITVPHY